MHSLGKTVRMQPDLHVKKGFGFLEDIFLKEFFLEFVLYFSHQFYKHFTVSEPKESN